MSVRGHDTLLAGDLFASTVLSTITWPIMFYRTTSTRASITRRCSGDDAVHVCGNATPRISRCKLQAKKCGVWVYEKAKPVLTDCAIEECGRQGVKLFDYAVVRMLRYAVLPSQRLAYENLSQQ